MTVTNLLLLQVRQLELVRGHGASNTDLLLEEEAVVGTSIIVIIVICSIVGVTIIVALLFFVSPNQQLSSFSIMFYKMHQGALCTL